MLIESYEVLAEKGLAVKTRTITPVAALQVFPSMNWAGSLYIIERIPINHPGGGDCAMGDMKESDKIDKSFSLHFIENKDCVRHLIVHFSTTFLYVIFFYSLRHL